MNFRSDGSSDSNVGPILGRLLVNSFYSNADGCYVVPVNCWRCARPYLEELETAVAKVISGAAYTCISCDREAARAQSGRITLAGIIAVG